MMLDHYNLGGKVAIVTGAGRGFGRTLAVTLAQAGAHVVVSARTEGDIQQTASMIEHIGRKSLAIAADVSNSGMVNRLVDQAVREFGRADILVNNAGGEFRANKPATEIHDNEWGQVLEANLTGTFYCARAVAQHMLAHGWGRIINVACTYGVRGSTNHAAYAAAKGGVIQLTQALALEWAKAGITVNTLGIGWFEGQEELWTQPELSDRVRRAIPIRRFGQAQDIPALLIYLASDASRYLTGQTIWLDGGLLCR